MKKALFLTIFAFSFFLPLEAKQARGPVFILHARRGSILPLKDPSLAKLIMNQVDQTVPFVYSHPTRRVGVEKISKFLQRWQSGKKLEYDRDPPDAYLLFYDEKNRDNTQLFIELLDMEFEEEIGVLIFKIRSLTDQPLEKRLTGEMTLFVDCFPFCL